MAKKRLNVTDVAEVLVDKIDDFMKESANLRATVEQLKNAKIELDDSSLNKLHTVNDEVKANLNNFSRAIAEQESHVPKWFVYLFAFFALLSIGAITFGFIQYNKKAAPKPIEYTELQQKLNKEKIWNDYLFTYMEFMSKKNPKDHEFFVNKNIAPE